MNNIIQIKRRLEGGGALPGAPTSLSGGELAFNEVDKVLYYGLSGGTVNVDNNPGTIIGIAGPGLFVDRTTNQTVSGVKTFQSTISALGDLEVDYNVDANSFSINGTSIITSSRDATFNDINVERNLVVTGNLTVQGDVTTLNTDTYQTSAFNITNEGSTTALVVNQTGITDIAEFQDGGTTALIIKGSTTAPGYVGIGTNDPNKKLTVVGDISATGTLDVNAAVNFGSTLTVTDAATLNSTLYVTNAATFASSVSAAGALTVDGTTTLNDDLTVTDLITVNSSSNANNITIDGTNHMISIFDAVNPGLPATDYTLSSIYTFRNGFTIYTDTDGGAGINFSPSAGSHTNVTQGNLNVQVGNLVGNTLNKIEDFIIDGGGF